MSVKALGPYDFPARDVRANFPAPLLYVGWENHLAFCAPHCVTLPEDMPFSDFVGQVLPAMYGQHPDFVNIDWDAVQWLDVSGAAWQPDMKRSLADNGLRHKSVVRFRTPGLTGIAGSGS